MKMELAISLFKTNIHEGYAGKEDKVYIESAISDDEDSAQRPGSSTTEEYDNEKTNVAEFLATLKSTENGAFSAVIPSLCPQNILLELQENKQIKDSRYDEFGFHKDECQHEFYRTNKLSEELFIEDSHWRMQWMMQLKFSKGSDMIWENEDVTLPRTDKFASMVRQGIPHSLRYQLWMRFSGALEKKLSSKTSYKDIMKEADIDELISSKQIEKDVNRTLPGNACFNSTESTGVPRLRRILRAVTSFFNDIGYCQGMGVIVGYLLLFMEEEDAFWTMIAIMEDLIPATYYTVNIPGVMADVKLIQSLLITYIPSIHEALIKHDVDITVILVSWLLPAFGNVVHIKVLLRIWDLFFFHGSIILLRVCFGILKLTEDKIVNASDGVAILNALTDAPGCVDDIEQLLQASFDVSMNLTDELLVSERIRHQAYLMVDRGTILGSPEAITNLPKQQLSRFKRIFLYVFSNLFRSVFSCVKDHHRMMSCEYELRNAN